MQGNISPCIIVNYLLFILLHRFYKPMEHGRSLGARGFAFGNEDAAALAAHDACFLTAATASLAYPLMSVSAFKTTASAVSGNPAIKLYFVVVSENNHFSFGNSCRSYSFRTIFPCYRNRRKALDTSKKNYLRQKFV